MRKTLTITSDRFLQDHCIDDHVVLPTVCAHELMRQVAHYLLADKKVIALNDYKLFKGIVFDGFDSVDLLFDYALENNGTDAQLEIKIASQKTDQQGNNTLQYHYAAKLLLSDTVDASNDINKGVNNIAKTDAKAPHEDCAQYYQNGCLFHGPSLQGLQKIVAFDANMMQLQVQLNNDKALAPSFSSDSHVFANDLAYQALLLWVFKQHDMNSLPTATASWRYYQTPTNNEMQLLLNITASNQHKTVADIQWLDHKGDLMAVIEGMEVTHAKGLREKFLNSAAKHNKSIEGVANA